MRRSHWVTTLVAMVVAAIVGALVAFAPQSPPQKVCERPIDYSQHGKVFGALCGPLPSP